MVKRIWELAIVVTLLFNAAAAYPFSLGKHEKLKITGDTAVIPVASLSDGRAHFYKIEDGGKEISFFAVKAADGTLKTAFDACDACYKSKKGYEQQGDRMNCKNCNQKFAINRLGPNATGGCNPGYLSHTLSGSSIIISIKEIKGGARYF